ncbi:unnamed protein product, partial [Choristocarpus tenellus]
MPWAGGNLRLVTDMARISVVCKSAQDLGLVVDLVNSTEELHVKRVSSGFRFSYTPGGYRDVKMN